MLTTQIRRNLFQFLKHEGLSHIIEKQNITSSKIKDYNASIQEKQQHYPVMVNEIRDILKDHQKQNQPSYMIDCTLGCGGHTLDYMQTFLNLHIVGLDWDQRMIHNFYETHQNQSKQIWDRLRLVNLNFKEILAINKQELFSNQEHQEKTFDFILADLGYSSFHLNQADWGFSYMDDGRLDMRYLSQSQNQTAADILNNADEYTLNQILRNYGDLKNYQQITSEIIKQRKIEKFSTTTQVRNLILHNLNLEKKFKTLVKLFQALRISVNQELDNLQELLQNIDKKLSKNGLAFFITFHSLEEQIVEQYLNVYKKRKQFKILKNQIQPSKIEISENIRSRSAKLYVIQKL